MLVRYKKHAKNIELGEYVVMPNHIHGILILGGNGIKSGDVGSVDDVDAIDVNAIDVDVETRHALSLHQRHQQWPQHQQSPNQQSPITPKKSIGQQRFQNQGKNTISSIIGGYKSAVTKHANRLNFDFGWHPRFHDHIIRDDEAFTKISDYIINNPLTWQDDKFY